MRHLHVTRLAWMITVLLIIACLIFAAVQN
jgi:hypothetical protein